MVDKNGKSSYNAWVLTKTLWPKVCFRSGKPIPMYTEAYCLSDFEDIETWILPDEFIIARLKGEV